MLAELPVKSGLRSYGGLQMVRKYREEHGGKNLHNILNREMGNPLGFAAFPRKN